jgi:hypothetical protein
MEIVLSLGVEGTRAIYYLLRFEAQLCGGILDGLTQNLTAEELREYWPKMGWEVDVFGMVFWMVRELKTCFRMLLTTF